MKHPNGLLADVALGAAAGLAGTWVMGRVTSFLYAREDERARKREDEARGGKTAFGVAAEKLAGAAGRELDDDERKKLGSAIHWALGGSAGAAYGALRHRVAAADAGHGLAFGGAFWALADEAGTVALGLTPGPASFPWQTHARGLAGHLAYGLVTDAVLSAADRLRH